MRKLLASHSSTLGHSRVTYHVPREFDPPTGMTYGFLPSFSNFFFNKSVRAWDQTQDISQTEKWKGDLSWAQEL